MYILDKGTKVVMWLDPTETDPGNEMKIKHDSLARKFQQRFCCLMNDVFGVFGGELVETGGWSFVYPLVAQHEPCSR